MDKSQDPIELAKTIVAVLTLVSTLIAFIAGLLQYTKAQRWKKAEFLALQIKDFDANPRTKLARQMLDFSGYPVEVSHFDGTKDLIQISHPQLAWHLRDQLGEHFEPPTSTLEGEDWEHLTDVDLTIRECFDSLFEATDRFQSYVESNLIESEDLDPYLGYVLDQMGGGSTGEIVEPYLNRYGYEWTLKLVDDRRSRKEKALAKRATRFALENR